MLGPVPKYPGNSPMLIGVEEVGPMGDLYDDLPCSVDVLHFLGMTPGMWRNMGRGKDTDPIAKWHELTSRVQGQIHRVYSTNSSNSSNPGEDKPDPLRHPTVTNSQRNLSPDEVEFLHNHLVKLTESMDKPFRPGDETVTIDHVVKFWEWWRPTLELIRRLEPCVLLHFQGRPVIHGFIRRDEAEKRLSCCEAGTFLLRFSESKPGKLVISFSFEAVAEEEPRLPSLNDRNTRRHRYQHSRNLPVHHCLVHVERDQFSIFDAARQGRPTIYPSLPRLIRDCHDLRFLEPDIPKATAFRFHAS